MGDVPLPRSISSIRGELVPYLVRKQFSRASSCPKDKEDPDQDMNRKDGNSSLGETEGPSH